MNKLLLLVDELESKIVFSTKINKKISDVNINWHLAHTSLVIIGIIKALKTSDVSDYKWAFNFPRLLVYTLNKIPKGKGKAPESVKPKTENTENELKAYLQKIKPDIQDLKNLPALSNFKHPYFGQLNVKQTIKFLTIHTQHHLNIINDIMK